MKRTLASARYRIPLVTAIHLSRNRRISGTMAKTSALLRFLLPNGISIRKAPPRSVSSPWKLAGAPALLPKGRGRHQRGETRAPPLDGDGPAHSDADAVRASIGWSAEVST